VKILYVEDDSTAREFVTKGLEHRGFQVEAVAEGQAGLARLRTGSFDLAILDVMLPDLDGLSILREVRRAKIPTPVLVLSARGEATDRIEGLDVGADDYLAKPFAFGELVSRIRAIARRTLGEPEDGRFCVADLVVDTQRHRVERAGHRIPLSAKQFAILEALIRSAGYVLSRSMILDRAWGPEFETLSNVIDVHIRSLRALIDEPFDKRLIHTVKGVGYVLEDRESTDAAREGR